MIHRRDAEIAEKFRKSKHLRSKTTGGCAGPAERITPCLTLIYSAASAPLR